MIKKKMMGTVATGALMLGMTLFSIAIPNVSANMLSSSTMVKKVSNQADEVYMFSFNDSGGISLETLAKYNLAVSKNPSGAYYVTAIAYNNSIRMTAGNLVNQTVRRSGYHSISFVNPQTDRGMDTNTLKMYAEYTDGTSEYLTPNISSTNNLLSLSVTTKKEAKIGFSVAGDGSGGGFLFSGYRIN